MNENKDIYKIKIFLNNNFRFGNKVNKEEGNTFLLTPEIFVIVYKNNCFLI